MSMITPDNPEIDALVKKSRLKQDLDNRFTYHPPKGDQASRYEAIRGAARNLAFLIADATTISREQSLALTKLDEVVMHANSAIARNE